MVENKIWHPHYVLWTPFFMNVLGFWAQLIKEIQMLC